jgi:hypothetical protein
MAVEDRDPREDRLPKWAQEKLGEIRQELAQVRQERNRALAAANLGVTRDRFEASSEHPMVDGILHTGAGGPRVGHVGSIPIGGSNLDAGKYEFVRWNLEQHSPLGRVIALHYAGHGSLVVLPQATNAVKLGIAYRRGGI